MSITTSIEQVTPAMASKAIDGQVFNRSLSRQYVDFLARQMRDGEWKVNGEAIVYDESGVMIDGQHRMAAVVECGKPIDFLVTRGIKRNAFPTIDTGRARAGGDALHMEGWTSARHMAAALAWVSLWEKGFGGVTFDNSPTHGKSRLSNRDIIGLAKKYGSVHDYIGAPNANTVGRRLGVSRGYMIFARWATHQAYPHKARTFWEGVDTGENLTAKSPAYVLRERLQLISSKRGVRVAATVILALVIKCWNAYVKGEEIGSLKFGDEEQFPMIAGLPCPNKAERNGRAS